MVVDIININEITISISERSIVMSKYEDIYSEYGLRKMIEDTKETIKEKKKEYQEVCEGKRYNPLCADGWKREISNGIKEYENHILELEESLKIKLSR
jgi:hypothetical protein